MRPIIEVRKISKKYRLGERQPYYSLRDTLSYLPSALFRRKLPKKNDFWALKEVSFEVYPGEVLGIIGPNGAGKSTLLKILGKITPPAEGEAVIYGRIASLLEVGTGFNPELTGRENIFLNGAILGMSRKEITSKFKEIVEFSGIEEFIETPVKRYSSGMYVRLAFAVAAHLEPEILLIDEVLAVGDAEFQKKCLQKMSDISSEGKRTIIFVSHNMAAIKNLCKRCIVLGEGKVQFSGDADKAIDFYLKSLQSMSEVPVGKRVDRAGSGLIRVTSVSFSGGFISGEPVSIILDYESRLPYRNYDISIELRIKSPMGDMLFALCNKYTGDDFQRIAKKGKFICKIASLPLARGYYSIDLRCKVNRQIVDKIDAIAKFYVEAGDFFGSGKRIAEGRGHFLVQHDWEVE